MNRLIIAATTAAALMLSGYVGKANEPFTANELLAEPNGFTTIAFVALITHKDICTDEERSEAFEKARNAIQLNLTATKKVDMGLANSAIKILNAEIETMGKGEFCRMYTKIISDYEHRHNE